MPRAPFQILVVPFRRVGEQVEFAVLRRQDMDVWQAVAGGGESGESPHQAAVREAREELGLDRTVALYPLQTTASIPARFQQRRRLLTRHRGEVVDVLLAALAVTRCRAAAHFVPRSRAGFAYLDQIKRNGSIGHEGSGVFSAPFDV